MLVYLDHSEFTIRPIINVKSLHPPSNQTIFDWPTSKGIGKSAIVSNNDIMNINEAILQLKNLIKETK